VLKNLYTDRSSQSTFMSNFDTMLKNQILQIQTSNGDQSQIDSLRYMTNLIDTDFWINANNSSSYTAPNGKTYAITYDNVRGYTSPNFINKNKYFNTLDNLKAYINKNNGGSSGISSSTLIANADQTRASAPYTAPNGKIYNLYRTTDKKYTSSDFIFVKTFTSLKALKEYINRSNPR
jgi:hypothetical protein